MALPDLGLRVLNVQRWYDSLSEHTRAAASGRAGGDAPIEDQLHPVETAEVEILADDLFEETLAGQQPVEGLNDRKLALRDRELTAIASGAVCGRERMRQSPEAAGKDRLDSGIQGVRDPLAAAGLVARPDAIVQRPNGEAALDQLAFQPPVAMQTEFRGLRHAGAEVAEERAEVAVEDVEVVVIGHRRRGDDRRRGLPLRVPPLVVRRAFLLRLSAKEHALRCTTGWCSL